MLSIRPGSRIGTADSLLNARAKAVRNRAAPPTIVPISHTPILGQRPSTWGHDHEVKIEPAAKQDDQRYLGQDTGTTLRGSIHQNDEGHHPIEKKIQNEEWLPVAVQPLRKVHRLLRQMRIPDQHVLAEPDVHPERAEREQHLAQV